MSAVAAAIRRKYRTVSPNEAGRLIHHCAMGAKQSEINAVVSNGYRAWVEAQLNMTPPRILDAHLDFPPLTLSNVAGNTSANLVMSQSYASPAQIQMRLIEVLSQFFVVNDEPLTYLVQDDLKPLWPKTLLDGAIGNFRTLLGDVSKSCMMGWYLTFMGNAKATGTANPDENYAREVMQLFSIGLWELNNDGSRKKNGELPVNDPRYVLNGTADVPTYTPADVRGLARVFTGWAPGPNPATGQGGGWPVGGGNGGNYQWLNGPMIQYPQYHELGTKVFLGVTIPENTPGEASMTIAMDTLFNHPSLPPFFCRQMIQRLTTSNPSPQYVARVVAAFINNGSGVRGDMKAVWKAILLDQEATSIYTAQLPTWGRVREPYAALFGRMRGVEAVTNKPSGWPNAGSTFRNGVAEVGQHPFRPTSVFGFWPPDHKPAGELANLEMESPELFALGESKMTTLFNKSVASGLSEAQGTAMGASSNWNPEGAPDMRLSVNMASWEADALNNVPAMVDRIILLMNGNTVSAATRDEMITRATSWPANQWYDRVSCAATILTNSPSYLVQR